MSNATRFILFFVVVIVFDAMLFYWGTFIFFTEPVSGLLGSMSNDSTEQVFYSLLLPIAGIVIFDIVAIMLFSKYGLKEE